MRNFRLFCLLFDIEEHFFISQSKCLIWTKIISERTFRFWFYFKKISYVNSLHSQNRSSVWFVSIRNNLKTKNNRKKLDIEMKMLKRPLALNDMLIFCNMISSISFLLYCLLYIRFVMLKRVNNSIQNSFVRRRKKQFASAIQFFWYFIHLEKP